MADRRRAKRKPKPLRVRLDEILEEAGTDRWSTVRLSLLSALAVFSGLAIYDEGFRDPGAFVTIILALIASVVAPKLLDLRVAIGQAAAAIGRRFTKTETIEQTTKVESNGEPSAAEVDADIDVDRSAGKQEP